MLTVDRRHDPFDTFLARALRVWVSTTALVALGTSVLYVATGSRDFSVLIQTGPASIRNQTLACIVIAWLSAGALLVLLRKSRSRPERCVAGVALFCLLLLYVNVLRERIEYGDVDDYYRAALALPTFDFYPWSFGRLASPLILIGLMFRGSAEGRRLGRGRARPTGGPVLGRRRRARHCRRGAETTSLSLGTKADA